MLGRSAEHDHQLRQGSVGANPSRPMEFKPQRVGGGYDWQLVAPMDESGLTFWATGSRLRWKIVPNAVSERGQEIGVRLRLVYERPGVLDVLYVRSVKAWHAGARRDKGSLEELSLKLQRPGCQIYCREPRTMTVFPLLMQDARRPRQTEQLQ